MRYWFVRRVAGTLVIAVLAAVWAAGDEDLGRMSPTVQVICLQTHAHGPDTARVLRLWLGDQPCRARPH
jgi:hypothetical protein